MLEIELKILDIDITKTTDKILQLGGILIGKEKIIDRCYDFEDGKIDKEKNLLRLRNKGGESKLTFKHHHHDEKDFLVVEETETEVGDFDKMNNILLGIGLNVIRDAEKKRTSFVLGNLKIEIDEYPKIPPYFEVEGPKEDIMNFLSKMGYDFNQTTSETASEVMRRYSVDPSNLKFDN